jgi:hypothetical protein
VDGLLLANEGEHGLELSWMNTRPLAGSKTGGLSGVRTGKKRA